MTDGLDLERALLRALALAEAAGLNAAVVGGLAVSVWGEARATKDVDFIADIAKGEAARFAAIARSRGYTVNDEELGLFHDGGGFLRLLQDGRPEFPLDILAADTDLHLEALARASVVELGSQRAKVISAEDLILMKLIAFRSRDTFDIEVVIEKRRGSLDLAYLRGWADRLQLRKRLETFLEEIPPG
jgi:predicted nucleotidyltransferase